MRSVEGISYQSTPRCLLSQTVQRFVLLNFKPFCLARTLRLITYVGVFPRLGRDLITHAVRKPKLLH